MYIDFFNIGAPVLYHSYRDDRNNNVNAYTLADAVQAVGHDWEWVFWDPDTGECQDSENLD